MPALIPIRFLASALALALAAGWMTPIYAQDCIARDKALTQKINNFDPKSYPMGATCTMIRDLTNLVEEHYAHLGTCPAADPTGEQSAADKKWLDEMAANKPGFCG